jgi:hypothetical protein
LADPLSYDAVAAFMLNLSPRRITAQAIRASLAASATTTVTASFGLLNRLDEGRQVVRRILELAPAFTVAWIRKHIELDMNYAFKKPGVADAHYEGLRRSGAPEA